MNSEFFIQILKNSSENQALIDEGGNFIAYSPGFQHCFGYTHLHSKNAIQIIEEHNSLKWSEIIKNGSANNIQLNQGFFDLHINEYTQEKLRLITLKKITQDAVTDQSAHCPFHQIELFLIDHEYRIEHAFYKHKDITNYKGQFLHEFLPANSSDKLIKFLKNDNKGNTFSIEYLINNADGISEIFQITCSSYLKSDGLSGYRITNNKLTSTAPVGYNFKAPVHQLQHLFENARDLIYSCNYKGHFVFMNEHARSILGDRIDQHFTTVIRGDYRDNVRSFYQHQFNNKIPSTYLEFPIISHEEQTIWIGQHVQMYQENDWILGFQAIARDITEQTKMEETIRENESRQRALLNSIPDIMCRLKADGTVLDFHPGSNESTIDKNRLIGSSIYDWNIPKSNQKRILSAINNALRTEKTQTVEYVIKVNEQIHSYEARIVKLNTDEVIATSRNISKTKKTERELIQARKNAEESSKTKEQFLSIMSHEIRTPLNAIVGLTNLLKEGSHNPDQLEFIQGIKYSSDNLLKLVNDLLDFTKIESNKLVLENTEFNLRELINSLVKSTKAGYMESGNTIKTTIDEHIPELIGGDPARLNQILTNLLSNALKFTTNGQIVINTEIKKQTSSKIELLFTIKDNGIGIPPDRLNTIFDSFTQANIDTTRKYGGTGLGLTITKELVELYGGTITAKSKVNVGSTFSFDITFLIPKKKRVKKEPTLPIPETKASLTNFRVLIAEDNEMNQLVIAKYLENWGASYDIAEDGAQAINLFRTNKYDMLLLDLEMPRIDGYDVARIIRNEFIEKSLIPIIAISASTLSKIQKKALRAGIDDFISKPVDYKALHSKLIEYAGLKSKDHTNNESNLAEQLDLSVINLSYLIESSLNDYAYITRMIEMFLKNTPQYIKTLKRLYGDKKYDDLKVIAHKFKASINIMGIKSAGILIKRLEDHISKSKKPSELESFIDGIEMYSLAACAELEKVLNSRHFSKENA